jgi:hypothetical protein
VSYFGASKKEVNKFKISTLAHCWWLTLLILATWEAEIGRIIVQGQSRKDPISKIIRAK